MVKLLLSDGRVDVNRADKVSEGNHDGLQVFDE